MMKSRTTKLIKIHLNTDCPFNTKEFEEALKILKDKKSPGPDKITRDAGTPWHQSKVQTPGNLQQQLEDRARSSELARSWHGTHPQKGQGSSQRRQLSNYQSHHLSGQKHGKINQHSPGMAPGEKQNHHLRAGSIVLLKARRPTLPRRSKMAFRINSILWLRG